MDKKTVATISYLSRLAFDEENEKKILSYFMFHLLYLVTIHEKTTRSFNLGLPTRLGGIELCHHVLAGLLRPHLHSLVFMLIGFHFLLIIINL